MAILSHIGRKFFDGYNVASTNFVYTANASTGADDGWISCKADYVGVQVCAATLDSDVAPTLTYRVEGRAETINRAASINVGEFSSAENIDTLITITPKMKEIRVGVKVSSVASDTSASYNSFYAGIFMSEDR